MKKPKEASLIEVRFKAGIRQDGQLIRVTISQGESEVLLTDEQALSLADQINAKVQLLRGQQGAEK